MANLKRAAALTLSAATFLQPMTASAVTWGNVLGFIRTNNGAEKKTRTFDDTTVEVQNGVVTITGGHIEEGVEISDVGPGFMNPGSVSHFVIGGAPDFLVLGLCVLFTLLWARIAARIANKAEPKFLNRATGAILIVLGAVVLLVNAIT